MLCFSLRMIVTTSSAKKSQGLCSQQNCDMTFPPDHTFNEALSKAHNGGNARKLFDTYLVRYFGLMVSDDIKKPWVKDKWMNHCFAVCVKNK
mmetsp:Transcript_15405/g.33373  ORF Transcript_15405/g.33373 Transcript_15405/m.33373 type:complete len:92 (-) Transcript_15405:181-456(-)